ncbi:hypothetical protein A5482_015110 (plasmid) [Cyanobacterium sp. IPPAS B-1200]|uniref:hypothetical protein n=1 Tax=Cyanobacterium sp. IPPAS B-1200 TaxID=1562720 RepID=UPI0008527302|nr:hypothetical protein [Cyanobacterium sp. IPPAS B-1200]OEJ78109.1 hypothetical protein A5482_14125 [Cyanobacterium sp. IPPAS B-1200]
MVVTERLKPTLIIVINLPQRLEQTHYSFSSFTPINAIKTDTTMFILQSHNLKPRLFFKPRNELYYDNTTFTHKERWTWVDKVSGRVHVESSNSNIMYCDSPLVLFWYVAYYDSEKDKNRKKKPLLPQQYSSVLRLKIEQYDPSKSSITYQKGILDRREFNNTLFPMQNKPSLINASFPASQQPFNLQTRWLNYAVLPATAYIPNTAIVSDLKNSK